MLDLHRHHHDHAEESYRDFTRRPSSKLGWAAVAVGAGSIALVVLFNFVIDQGPGLPFWQRLILLLSLVASSVTGLIAAFRRYERSWLVIVPTVLVTAAIANELLQGVLQLLGVGGD